MNNTSTVDEVVGFDLGHGETAVARLSLAPSSTPQILPIDTRNSQVTAVGVYDGAIIVGEAVIRSLNVTDVRVGFKLRPPGTAESRKAVVDFVSKYHQILTSSGQIAGGERTHYFVGCPSGWSKDEMKAYQTLLEEALPKVSVVRESRAALIQAKEERKIPLERLRSSVVVIDLGSSTIDVSYIFGGIRDENLDVGTELGGHLIEKEILRRAIQRSRWRNELEAFFAANENERRVAEVLCREVKEHYWSLESTSRTERRNSFIPVGNDGRYLEPILNPVEVESILTSPLPELGDASWRDTFLRFLEQIRVRLTDRHAAVDVLVLTGGPSKMSFVRDLCREQFRSADFVWCTPPEEAVAIGLARWGGIQLRTTAFSAEVAEICQTVVPTIVSRHMEDLRTRLATQVARGLADDVIAPTARQWRAGDIRSLDDMQEKIIHRAAEWIHSASSIAAIKRAYEPILETVNREVDMCTYEVCIKHGVPPSSLQLKLDMPAGGDDKFDVGVGPFDTLVGVASGIAFAILIVLTGIAKGALATATLASGPPGWLVAGLIAAWAALFGVMGLDAKLKSADLPILVRDTFLSDDRLAKLTRESMTTLEGKLKDAFGEEQMQKIHLAIAGQVSDFLNARADEVKWIIAPSTQS
ncbi:MAG TPA: Hsp70 family protein [Thermoanaerobaculia bacterium]|nr:Hsp70 family protein [Thermoanaerobaculia bacterium]